jgi:hypothetical protein
VKYPQIKTENILPLLVDASQSMRLRLSPEAAGEFFVRTKRAQKTAPDRLAKVLALYFHLSGKRVKGKKKEQWRISTAPSELQTRAQQLQIR